LECSPVDLTGTPAPSADRHAVAAQAGVYTIRQARVDADVSAPGGPPGRPLPEIERDHGLIKLGRGRVTVLDAGGIRVQAGD